MRRLAITDFARASLDEHVAAYRTLAARLEPGQLAIQVRIPAGTGRELYRAAKTLLSVGCPVVINDRLDVARALGLGAHLGGRSVSVPEARALLGPHVPLSVACHDEAEIARARDDGASYALVSPVFDVPGKGAALGLAGLARLVAVAGALPVLALGGVDEASAPACVAQGAVGFAAIRAFLSGTASHR